MAKGNGHEKRRKVRAAEAKRDSLLIKKDQIIKDLQKARLELSQAKKSK